jgi:hypothetical protein
MAGEMHFFKGTVEDGGKKVCLKRYQKKKWIN